MANIQTLIRNCFEIWKLRDDQSARVAHDSTHFMEIPMDQDTFELPAIASNAIFLSRIRDNMADMVALPLCYKEIGRYKGTAACIQSAIEPRRRIPIQIPNPEAGDSPYYCACGTIFDKNFQPVIMVSWVVERVSTEGTEEKVWAFKFRFLKPILRVSPEVFINKSNSIERYIINHIVPKTLAIGVRSPAYNSWSNAFVGTLNSRSYIPQVIIDKIPFEVKKVSTPSISTTNKELLNVALSNIEEVMT